MIVVLVLIWAAVLVPPVLRNRAERRAEFIDSFREQMGALDSGRAAARVAQRQAARSAPSPAASAPSAKASRPRRKASPQQRRRDILGGLLGAMIGSLVLGAIPSLRLVWVLHLFLLNLFIGYCPLLAHHRRHMRHAVRAVEASTPAPVRNRRLAPALEATR